MAANTTRPAFTLVELVVVIMILGILAAIAAPRLLGESKYASDNAARQTLSVVRDAIDHYAADHQGALPGADGLQETLKSDLAKYLRGNFPKGTVDAAKSDQVRMMSAGDPAPPGVGGTVGVDSWAYKYDTTGDFYINSHDVSVDGVTTYDQF